MMVSNDSAMARVSKALKRVALENNKNDHVFPSLVRLFCIRKSKECKGGQWFNGGGSLASFLYHSLQNISALCFVFGKLKETRGFCFRRDSKLKRPLRSPHSTLPVYHLPGHHRRYTIFIRYRIFVQSKLPSPCGHRENEGGNDCCIVVMTE